MAGMKLVMDVWNQQVKGYLERVGSYRLPANYSAAVAPGISTKLNLGSTPVTVQTESLEIIKYDGKVMAKVGMYMTNHGGKAWNDRGLEPYLVTASGSTFLLQREAETEGVLIQPKEKKLVYYITEVPSYLKTAVSHELLDWYEINKRDLPWRRHRDPYYIWVSEIMLQQTRVDTVIPYFHRFIERFPTIQSLADAPEDDVLKCWEGLGYYSRARNLQAAARQVTEQYGLHWLASQPFGCRR